MAGVYRNDGARWTRADGTVIEKGMEFVPTDDERLRRAYKLTYLRPSDQAAANLEYADERDLEDFATGNGWYMIGGESVHGREAALARLDELLAEEQRQREAYRLDVRS